MAACSVSGYEAPLTSEPSLRFSRPKITLCPAPHPIAETKRVASERPAPAVASADTNADADTNATRVLAAISDPEVTRALRRRATRLVHDPVLAEDCVQESLLQAYLHADQLHASSAVLPWLRTIVINVCRMETRARSRQRRGGGSRHLDLADVHEELLASSAAEHPETWVMANQLARGITHFAQQAPKGDRELMHAYVEHVGSLGDFAKARASTPQMVKARVYRIRKKLHAQLVRARLLEVS